ncbi:MAG: hypothetical protein KC435_01380 [Thermomicrobiales bacterium]|nr:hypothetical protein [Thermomicrobiales bacterium]
MTSRDGSSRYNRPSSSSQSRQTGGFGLDADELDRYMSGQPAKQPRFDPYGRSQSTGQMPAAPQQFEPEYQDDYGTYADDDQDWQEYEDDGYGYEDEYEPAPVAPTRRQTSRRQPVVEYEDDLYDDPYVDDEEIQERPQRRRPQERRPRQNRGGTGFALPPMIAEAPLVKDRMSLSMFGAGLLSVIVMIIVVALKRDGLDAVIPTHINANGGVQVAEDSSAVWRMPLIAGMITLISGVIAWFLARWGHFLPRFLLGGSLAVQFVVWVGIFAYLIK